MVISQLMPAKESSKQAATIQHLAIDEEMDNLPLKLTTEEKEVLDMLLADQRAYTAGEIQRRINDNTFREKKIAWKRLEGILTTLENFQLITREAPPNDDKRAKSRIFLEPSFASRWRNRRVALIRVCQEFPNIPPIKIIGGSHAYFYRITTSYEETANNIKKTEDKMNKIYDKIHAKR